MLQGHFWRPVVSTLYQLLCNPAVPFNLLTKVQNRQLFNDFSFFCLINLKREEKTDTGEGMTLYSFYKVNDNRNLLMTCFSLVFFKIIIGKGLCYKQLLKNNRQ